ncbi:MAG: carbon-nitrogen hydrolase family protein [Bdellovibrionaceae bacterium]|nr:carbon-nitrogen hydrolase family protein [Pseudobdellovibrionaceae bacterium]MBX3034444.1 carbon-nitrogen hydrolase family protein [Pseudobdellovibrionaceae bacterium]
MTSSDDVEANLMQMENLLERIPDSAGVRAAFFPENALYTRLIEGEKIVGVEIHDEILRALAVIAKKRRLHLHLTTPVRLEHHVYNASLHINDLGEVSPSYQKMHLFDIALVNGPSVRESDSFRHGSGLKILEIDGWKFGQSICYDVRFAELYATYARQGVDAILVPSAFLVRTGEAHWEVLLRARAIESQAYVLAPAQAGVHHGRHGGMRETYGHSLIVDPWGTVQARLTERGPAVALHTLQSDEIEKVRRQIPMKDHRRLPVSF